MDSIDRKVWRNVAGLVGGNSIGEILSLAVHVQMMYILGPSGIGRYAQATAIADVADGISAFGMNQVGPVLGVNYIDRLGKFLGTLLALRGVVSLLVLSATVLLAPLLQSTDETIVRLAVLILLFTPLGNTATVPFFLHQENTRIAWVPGTTAIFNMLLLMLVLWTVPRVELVVLTYVLSRAFHSLMVNEAARRRYKFKYGFDWTIVRALLKVGPKAGWLDMVVIIYSKASYVVLDSLGSVMLGIYAVADKIAGPALRITGAMSASSLPMFAELAQRGDLMELRGFYWRNLKRIGIGLAVVGIIIYGIIPPILRSTFAAYEKSIPVLYILFGGVCFMAVNQMTTSCLNGLGKFGWVAVVATINLLIYALGAWLWVEPYQATGAAMATAVMEACNMIMQLGLLTVALQRRFRG